MSDAKANAAEQRPRRLREFAPARDLLFPNAMRGGCPPGFEQIRAEAVRRMFARTPRLKLLIFEPTFAGFCLYTVIASDDGWRRVLAATLLLSVVVLHAIARARPSALVPAGQFVLGFGLVAATGGPRSPILPVLLISVLSSAAILGRRAAWWMGGLSIAGVWVLTLAPGPRDADSLLRAGCMTPLLAAAAVVGTWIGQMSDGMLRTSLEARDELLRGHAERLRELTALQGEIAHALKNPLQSIKGLTGLMALEPARAPERLEVLRREVCRMQNVIDEYLSFSRPLTPLDPRPIDVRALCGSVAALYEGLARDKQVVLELSRVEAVELVGDLHKLKQILISLLVNAIDAVHDRGAESTIELSARAEGADVVLAVLDRGPGVPPEVLPRLTAPGVTTKENGTGLGLTIVRALAEQHGGSLALENREGGGLAAVVRLPRTCPADARTRPLA